ncbi:hypothetical protein [Gaiella sp.]|uniref:hypothetical protein n=1 Tax=Gaiella sp. TaxID=2663207 RepID=UPI002E2F1A57|nr:hypothetical protein [Gaiella sp.]HEX5584071.1 hypothetical protein [Gaiella sp.]
MRAPILVVAAALVVLLTPTVLAGAASASPRAPRAETFTLHAVSTKRQFVNNTDDRARGQGKNPFGNYTGTFVTPPTDERAFGPFAGDEGIFVFALYSDAGQRKKVGSATFICAYTFGHDAVCDASFRLERGILVGKGAFDYDATRYRLAILGGTSGYRSMRGVVEATTLGVATQTPPIRSVVPMLQHQRLVFRIG